MMENCEGKDSSQCVRVAVNIRPFIPSELLIGCTNCITVVPGEPQVQIGSHAFTYDYVYGFSGSPYSGLYDECVAPLLDAFFKGYNATVLAYGQTRSGKTYTMGTNYHGEDNNDGIVPKVMDRIFKQVEAMRDSIEFIIRVSFIEIFKDEVFDLLDMSSSAPSRGDVASTKTLIQIRETVNGGIKLAGVSEPEVNSKEEMANYFSRGSISRATASTDMNSQSSRSHAIFTITLEQKKSSGFVGVASNDDVGDDILCAKIHLVDLVGSERAKRTGADGLRFKEGIHINKGLLSLGNVISALGDEKKRRDGGHVPYRDSKLTRLLQDSMGGNSKTLMIACVSPAETNAEETLNTLIYANRARNIHNKAVVKRDPMAAEMQRLRSQVDHLEDELLRYRGGANVSFEELQLESIRIEKVRDEMAAEMQRLRSEADHLEAELLLYRGSANVPFEELQILKCKVSLLEASNQDLRQELQERQTTCEHLMVMKLESILNEKVRDEMAVEMQRLQSQVDHLEAELLLYRGSANVPFEELQIFKHKVSLLEAGNQNLRQELQERQTTCEHLMVERDKLIMELESIRNGKVGDEIDADVDQDTLLRKQAKSSRSQRNALPLECNKDLGASKYNNMRKQDNLTSTMFMEDVDVSEADNSDSDNDSNDLVGCSCSEDMDISEADNSGSDDDSSDLVGCSCSELAYCKTTRCQCLVEGSYCGKLCGCVSTKCTNRIMSKGTAQHDSEHLAKANAPKPSRRKK